MTFSYKKELYPKEALLKAAFHFTDVAYIHLDANDQYYLVELQPKEDANIDEKSFENEMLAQIVRYSVYQQTKDIREISLARALASSVVEKPDEGENESKNRSIAASSILKNWFKK